MQKDDVIYRQVAIDAIDECFKKAVRARNMSAYEYDSAYVQGEIDAYVTAIDTLKALAPVQPEPKWILCSKELPKEEEQSYWVCLENGYQSQCKWKRYEGKDGYIYQWHSVSKVVAWMPLPKPTGGEVE